MDVKNSLYNWIKNVPQESAHFKDFQFNGLNTLKQEKQYMCLILPLCFRGAIFRTGLRTTFWAGTSTFCPESFACPKEIHSKDDCKNHENQCVQFHLCYARWGRTDVVRSQTEPGHGNTEYSGCFYGVRQSWGSFKTDPGFNKYRM